MKSCIVHLAVLIALFSPAAAQTPSGSGATVPGVQKAADVLSNARAVYLDKGAKVALPEYENALALFRAENDRLGEAITLGYIGNCYKQLGDFPKALDFLQRALAMKRQLANRVEEGKTLSHLGLLYWRMGQYPLAIEHFNSAIKIGDELKDNVLQASSRNNLGLIYQEMAEFREADEQFNRSLELYLSAPSRPGDANTIQRGINDAIGNLGGTRLLLGNYSEALRYYQQALANDERLKLKAETSLDLQNIGLSYVGLGRAEESLSIFDKSIQLANETGSSSYEADSRKGKGSALVQLGRYSEALAEYRRALKTYEEAGLQQNLVEGLDDLGNLELRFGDVASAEKEFTRSLEVAGQIKHPRGVVTNLISLGNIEWQRKRSDHAAALFREAIKQSSEMNDRGSEATARVQLGLTLNSQAMLDDADKEAQQALELARATQAMPVEIEALFARGEIARSRNNQEAAISLFTSASDLLTRSPNPEMSWRVDYGRGQALEAIGSDSTAIEAYEKAVKTIEAVRGQVREERFRAGYIEDKYQVYVSLVQLLLKVHQPLEAFYFAERLHARSYLDLLGRPQATELSELQRQKEIELQNRISLLRKNITSASDKPTPEQRNQAFNIFSNELAQAERALQDFLDEVTPSKGAEAANRSLGIPSITEVQNRIPADTALIEYVSAPTTLSIFVVTTKQLYSKTVEVGESDLSHRVELMRALMLRNRTDEWKLPAAKLYEQLIGPIEDSDWLVGIKHLYIVPHSALHYLPFAALQKSNHSLIEQYVVGYLPAAAALIYGGSTSSEKNSVLALAPENAQLQYTQQESQAVSAFFPQQHTLLLGDRATETSFKRLSGNYDVIHLATHGYFNKLNPAFSGLMLAADQANDGHLEVHEILNLKLKAKLVTLSACDTALGTGYFTDIPAGDDLVGLTRAFLFAGAPSVLASLWEVNDRSAVRFMDNFYSHLRTNDKASSLALAQREMLLRGPYRHPYYWAAFVMVGEMK